MPKCEELWTAGRLSALSPGFCGGRWCCPSGGRDLRRTTPGLVVGRESALEPTGCRW
jgi:hypothetical protein